MNLAEKVEVAKQIQRLGVDVIEAGFPAASPGDAHAVAMVARTVRGVKVAALARAIPADIDIAWDSIKDAESPRIHTFIATSPIHMEYKLKKSPAGSPRPVGRSGALCKRIL